MNIPGLIALIILCAFVLLFITLLFLKIKVEISFEKSKEKKAKTLVSISFLGGKFKKIFDFSKEKEPKKKKENEEKLSFTQKVKKYHENLIMLRYIWSKSKKTVRKNIFAKKLEFSVTLGTDDASSTGIAVGSLWALVYTAIGFISDVIRICVPDVSITPDYENECFEAKLHCIIEASPANIISIAARLLISYYRIKKQTKKEKAAINYGNTN